MAIYGFIDEVDRNQRIKDLLFMRQLCKESLKRAKAQVEAEQANIAAHEKELKELGYEETI